MIKFVKFAKRFPHVTLPILHENQEATLCDMHNRAGDTVILLLFLHVLGKYWYQHTCM